MSMAQVGTIINLNILEGAGLVTGGIEHKMTIPRNETMVFGESKLQPDTLARSETNNVDSSNSWILICITNATQQFWDCGDIKYIPTGSGTTCTWTPNIISGYVFFGYKIDGGATTIDKANPYVASVPTKAAGSHHTLQDVTALGWIVRCTGTTDNGYHAVVSNNTYTANSAGAKDWYLDGVFKTHAVSYIVPIQTNGTEHTLTAS